LLASFYINIIQAGQDEIEIAKATASASLVTEVVEMEIESFEEGNVTFVTIFVRT